MVHGWHRFSLLVGRPLRALGAGLWCGLRRATRAVAPQEPRIRIWHGHSQRVGHLGRAQDDFNLLGNLVAADGYTQLAVDLNGSPLMPLKIAAGPTGFRRLAGAGHFNADIPLSRLRPGTNRIVVRATDGQHRTLSQEVLLDYQDGDCRLPFLIRWRDTTDPQTVGQYVDGEWSIDAGGLRTRHTGYDRIFLIGNRSWQDFEVETSVTIHQVAKTTGPLHGGNGVGLMMRFGGHITGGHRCFPADQPKWGYQPFGAIGWLRWKQGWPGLPPRLEYYRGDRDGPRHYGLYGVTNDGIYRLKMACETLADAPDGAGVTRYSFKIWPDGLAEPGRWRWQTVQTSPHALRQGGVGLLAHHVDVTFGDVAVTPLAPAETARPLGPSAIRAIQEIEPPARRQPASPSRSPRTPKTREGELVE